MERKELIEMIKTTINPPKDFDYDQYETEYLEIWFKLVDNDNKNGYNNLIGKPINTEIPAIKYAKVNLNVDYK